MVLAVGLVALIPDDTPEIFALTLVINGVIGLLSVGRAIRLARTDPDPRWRQRQALLRFLLPAVAYSPGAWAPSLSS